MWYYTVFSTVVTTLDMWYCIQYVCMHGQHLEQSMYQPGVVTNLACGQLNRKNDIFSLSPFAPQNLAS